MADKDSRLPSRAEPFKNGSEADNRLVRRLVMDRTGPQQVTGSGNTQTGKTIDVQALADVFRRNLRDVSDIANIFKVMPDLNLPRDILVSAICAPGDLTTCSINIDGKVQGTDSQLTSMMVDRLKEHYIDEEQMHNKVHEWIDEALILHGAHPILIIPEAALDRMINGADSSSLESAARFDGEWLNGWFKPKGILGLRLNGNSANHSYASFESVHNRGFSFGDMPDYHTIKGDFIGKTKQKTTVPLPIRVTDNMAALRLPAVQEIRRSRAMQTAYGELTLESRRRERLAKQQQEEGEQENGRKDRGDVQTSPGVKKGNKNVSDSAIYSRFFRKPQQAARSRMQVVPTLKQSGGKTVGHPLIYHLPTQSVIPVCIPGDRKNHIGYWVIQDGNGFPVASVRTLDYYDDVRRGMLGGGEQVGSGNQIAGELLNMAAGAMNGGIANASDIAIDRMATLCGDVIERDLMSRLKSGVLGGEFELARTDHIDKLMLARTLKNQQTTLLYVPAEMMVYMAYDFNEYGVGKSILEDAKGLCAMRANLMVAHVMGSISNAIPGKDIVIELDPADKDPTSTVGFLVNEAMALAFNQLPMAINSPQGIAEALQMTSYSVSVTGNPRFPEIKTSIQPRESQQVAIDTDTLQQARDDVTRVFSVTPEMVDNMNQPEFATTAVNNNLMLLKRVMMVQRQTNPMLTDYVRISTMNDGILIDDLLDIIEKNKKWLPDDFKDDYEVYLQEFINSVEVTLPAPDIDNLEKHMELYDKYEQNLDKIIAAFIKDEYLDGYATQIQREALPTIIAAWKGVQLRKFLRDRGLFREMDIFGNAEDGSPLMELNDEMAAHVEVLNKAFAAYSRKAAKDAIRRKERNAAIEDLDEEAKQAAEAQPLESDDTLAPEVDSGDQTGDGQDDDIILDTQQQDGTEPPAEGDGANADVDAQADADANADNQTDNADTDAPAADADATDADAANADAAPADADAQPAETDDDIDIPDVEYKAGGEPSETDEDAGNQADDATDTNTPTDDDQQQDDGPPSLDLDIDTSPPKP